MAQANVKLADNVSVGGFYVRGNKDIYTMNDNGKKPVKTNKAVVPADKDTSSTTNVYGFNTDMNFGNVWVGGEWLKANYDNSNAWVAGIGYGNYDQAVAGTWDVKAQYMYANVAAPILSNTYSFQDAPFKGWLATVDYAVAKNVGVTAYYGFANKSVDTDAAKDNQKQADYYQAELNFKF